MRSFESQDKYTMLLKVARIFNVTTRIIYEKCKFKKLL